jgi:mono/diheme cytochrome c family protein
MIRWCLGLALVVSSIALVGCSGGTPAPAGDAARGRQLFLGEQPFLSPDAPGCTACHAINPAEGNGIGNNLAGIGATAETRVAGQNAAEYLRTALINPDAYLVDGYQEGIMYRGYAEVLTPQEIEDLIAFMLTLR